MNRHHTSLLAATALLALASCADEPLKRHVQLSAVESAWPGVTTTFVGSALRVEVARMEPLPATAAMNVWLVAHDGSAVRAGVLDPAEATFFDGAALNVVWEHIHQVVITEESAAQTPTTPSRWVLFSGEPGGALTPDHEGALTGLTATAELSDGTLTLTAPNLPLLGTRMFYGVWLIGAHTTPTPQPTYVGRVYGRGTAVFHDLVNPERRHEVAISIELESGPDALAAQAVVLRGLVPTSPIATSTGGAATPEAAPAHVH